MAGDQLLIIEDDPVLSRGLCDNFRQRGFKVEAALDGETGLDRALRDEADLILLDIMLPEINGFELCRQVRTAGLSVPIIMLTAKGQEEDVVRGLHLGADDYVTKPFSIRELVARVQAFLRRYATPPAETYEFGEFKLDTASRRLLQGDIEIEVAPKEYRLLELFVRSAGRALTRDQILDAVWGRSVLVTSRSVDRCITTLRGKIEPDARRPRWIRTVRDVGYRFDG